MGAILAVLNLSLIKFRVNDKYCDYTIHVENKSFGCHRRILVLQSGYFDVMFASNFEDKNAKHITLKGLDSSTFALILQCIYSNTEHIFHKFITNENLFSLIVSSDYLRVYYVAVVCEVAIKSEVNPIPAIIDIFIYARTMKNQSLILAVCEHINRHILTISKSVEFLELSLDDFKTLLNDLNRCPVYEVWSPYRALDVIKRWVNHARGVRFPYFEELDADYCRNYRFQIGNGLRQCIKWQLEAGMSNTARVKQQYYSLSGILYGVLGIVSIIL